MNTRKSTAVFFAIEGVNALATTFFNNYVYFLLRDRFHFGNLGNLSCAALGGFVYMVAAWQGGRFAQRFGYFTSLKIGLLGIAASLMFGLTLFSLPAMLLTMVGWMTMVCFTWPALEALVSDGVDERLLPRNIGIYNILWAAPTAATYFFGGMIYEKLGPTCILWLPALVHVGLFLVILGLGANPPKKKPAAATPLQRSKPASRPMSVSPTVFLRMVWLAIPFSYVGVSTITAIIPGLAKTLGLSTAQAGLFCSIWMFARLAAFIILWQWQGWHYRFRWLLGAFVGLTVSFSFLLLLHNLALLVVVQLIFGASIGLIYYSSLFYSMDVGDAKGEHGGVHEAMIGMGNCLGPATGALTLCFVPGVPNAGVYAVTALLTCGLIGLIRLRVQRAA